MVNEIISVAVYSVAGIILMILGNFLIDLVVPCHFPTEIKKGNTAVGWLSAGSFIGIGFILRSAIMTTTISEAEESFVNGLLDSVAYFSLGIIFFILGYFLLNLFHRKYNLSEEIGKGNTAAGIMLFGIFIGLGLVISGVIA